LSETAAKPLKVHLEKVREIYETDRQAGVAGVYLPNALSRKYPENENQDSRCQLNGTALCRNQFYQTTPIGYAHD
jgi:hypothetical protein